MTQVLSLIANRAKAQRSL